MAVLMASGLVLQFLLGEWRLRRDRNSKAAAEAEEGRVRGGLRACEARMSGETVGARAPGYEGYMVGMAH